MPSVSVNTILDLMIGLRVRTPNSLKVEVEEINICLKFIDKVDGKFSLSVREGAVVSILTLAAKADRTELGPVFIGVIKFFDSSVAVVARVTHGALLFLGNVAAKFRLVRAGRPASVFGFFVIVGAHLQVVAGLMIRAYFSLKSV